MDLCLNTRMWAGQPLEEALAVARATGISSLDLAATPDCPHLRPDEGVAGAKALLPVLDGFQVVAVTADHPDLPRAEDDGGEAAAFYTIAAVKAASALGARVVGVSLGSTDVDAWETAWNRAVSALRQVLYETARSGVRLAVELHSDDVLNSLRRARRLLSEINDPRLGLAIDTGYLHYLRIHLREALEIAGDRLFHVHLRDAARNDPFRSIGRGDFSFPAAFRALREYGYAGPLAIELYKTQEQHGLTLDEALAESIPRLQEWLAA
ncbi:MAG TPA: sugar phosphate isomerase/epimerase [Armatimonadota bacterium]|nr:sugar phosphate isomerase/epimerase [Armatimonadota bacterium]